MLLLLSGATSDEGENEAGRTFYRPISPTEKGPRTKNQLRQESFKRVEKRVHKMKTRSNAGANRTRPKIKVPKGLSIYLVSFKFIYVRICMYHA